MANTGMLRLPPSVVDYVYARTLEEYTSEQAYRTIRAFNGPGTRTALLADEEVVGLTSRFFTRNANVARLLRFQDDTPRTVRSPVVYAEEQPPERPRRYVCLEHRHHPRISALKLSNVMVNEHDLLAILADHRSSLRLIELKSVSLIMDDPDGFNSCQCVSRWMNIIDYIQDRVCVRKLVLEHLSWHDRVDNLASSKVLQLKQNKYHPRLYDPRRMRHWFKLHRTGMAAEGVLGIADGLEKFKSELDGARPLGRTFRRAPEEMNWQKACGR